MCDNFIDGLRNAELLHFIKFQQQNNPYKLTCTSTELKKMSVVW